MTIYFVNEGISTSNSGIEHAEFERARLFRKNNQDFKLLTSAYIPKLHRILPMFALSDHESINLFDYFQQALVVPRHPTRLTDIDFGVDAILEPNENSYHAFVNGHLIGRIRVNNSQEVEQVEYFDGFHNLYKVVTYDSRGFASLVQYYSPDNRIEVELWLSPEGVPMIEKTYTLNRYGNQVESWKVDHLRFRNLQELRLYFYNQINKDRPNMFILDRVDISEWQLLSLNQPAFLAFMLHNHQSSDAQNPDAALLNDSYEWALHNMDKWNCVISSTPQQTHDVKKRWQQSKCFTVPVGIIKDMQLTQTYPKMHERKPHSMLVTARVAMEKGIDRMIKAMAIARKEIPDLTLDVYGYVDASNDNLAMKRITEALDHLDDPNAVTFNGHASDVGRLHETHQVYLIFSYMEGFNLALMEALSAGMVGLTNNVYYGPNELIQDGKNGYIVGYDDINAYAKRMVDLFKDPEQLQTFSDNALQLSQRYSDEHVWQAWTDVLNEFDKWSQIHYPFV